MVICTGLAAKLLLLKKGRVQGVDHFLQFCGVNESVQFVMDIAALYA